GGAKLADGVPLGDLVAVPDVKLAHVGEERAEPVAMVEDDRAAGEEEVGVGERNDAATGRLDRRAERRRHVDAEMRLPRLAVEDALTPVDAADRTDRRPFEAAGVEGDAGDAGAGRIDAHLLRLDALQLLGIRLDLILRQPVDALDLER